MNARDAINFAKSPTGAFLGFCLLLGFVLFMVKGFKPANPKSAPMSLISKASAATPPQTMQTVQNADFTPMKIPPTANPDPQREEQPQPTKNTAPPAPEILPLSLFAETPEPEPKQLSKNYAPYGRLIPCELIVTVDSAAIRTPIIGLITEDMYHAGRLIIPAGTEVHGTAQTDRTRERIASGNGWTLVWKTGEELTLSGIALDRETNPDGDGWGIRHIEDIDSRALTYAEVKAIASGNPLVIEKASVDAEITRLTRLRSQHGESQYRIRSQARHLKEEIPVLTQRIENLKLDMAVRQDTRGDAFEIEIAKSSYKDRAIAGELINRIAHRAAGGTQEQPIGLFAGFQLCARPTFMERVEIVLKGRNHYVANVSDTPLGTIRSVEYTAQNMEERLQGWQRNLSESEKNSRELESKIGQPFEHESKLQSLALRQQELENALDITKNQAANSLSAEESNEPENAPAQKIDAPAHVHAPKAGRKTVAVKC